MSPTTFSFQDPPTLAFSPKRIAERLTYGFDFINLLNSGEALTSGTWYINPLRPVGAPLPVAMIFGSPNIQGTSQIFQQIQSGTEGVLYNVVAQVTTNFNNVLEQDALLLTSNDPFE